MINKRCICLFSGGLDSVLAIKVMQEQGIECIPVNFKSPFFGAKKVNTPEFYGLDVPIQTEDVSAEFMKILRNPAHGYGSVVNPCIDCKILIMKTAKSLLSKYNASFIVSGEVLGQRPMSQQRQSMELIAKVADVTDILLRPLSAKLMEPTLPERENVVDRSKLLDISGRSRKCQLALVKKYNIAEFAQPAGGCILTEPQFAVRIHDYLSNYEVEDYSALKLLTLGRHYRIGNAKVVVGRNEFENNLLTKICKQQDILINPVGIMGPTAVIHCNEEKVDKQTIELVGQIVLAYSDCNNGNYTLAVDTPSESYNISVERVNRDSFSKYMLVK